MSSRKRILCALIGLICLSSSWIAAAEPSSTPSPSPSPTESASPAATLTQSVSELSAQRAAAERSKIYRAGADYGRWLDNLAKNSGSAFLQRPVFERVTWMRLLASAGALTLLALLAGWFVWIVGRRAGEIQSSRPQSWLALSASAIRKPFALFLLMCGGGFALMPIVTGIVGRPTRLFWAGALTAILYAGWIIAVLWLIFRAIRAVQKRMNLWAERTNSLLGKVIVPAVVIIASGSILMLFDPVRQFGTSILASAGIAGVVLGFAAQKTLGNVLAGIQIALTQPLLIDDIVVVEGEFGQIEEITLTYVTVRTWDLRRMILPITYFVEKPFQNWSRVSTELLGTVILYLDYQVPLGELRKELKRLVENNPKWDRRVCGLQA